VKISVSDTGIGIDKEDQRKLFKAFTKIDLGSEMHINSRGVGLGLSISNALVQLLGPLPNNGIDISSIPGVGSTFSFLLAQKYSTCCIPRAKSCNIQNDCLDISKDTDEIYATISSEEQLIPLFPSTSFISSLASRNTLRSSHKIGEDRLLRKSSSDEVTQVSTSKCVCSPILVVDDDTFNVMALESLLKLLNFTCDSVYNGCDAIEKVAKRQHKICGINCKQYKLIFMDCSMPVLNGLDTTKKIKLKIKLKELSRMTIIGCTAFSTQEIIINCLNSGMDDVLTKPIHKLKLKEVLMKYIQ